MIRGILFDKDGTLLEFGSTMHAIYNQFIELFSQKWAIPEQLVKDLRTRLGFANAGLKNDSLLRHSTNQQIAEAVLAVCQRQLPEKNLAVITTREILTLIDQVSLAEDVPYTALPGVLETLTYLHTKGYPMGVVTADSRQATIAGLQKTGIYPFFGFLGTGDMERPKPDAYFAEVFARQSGLSTAEILVVGDSLSDMHFAANAGAEFVGIVSCQQDENSFRNAGRITVRSFAAIITAMGL